MNHPLVERVRRVQTRARRLVWLHAGSRFLAAAVATIAGLGILDYLLRLNGPVTQWLFSALAVGLVGWLFTKLAFPAIFFRQSRIAAAQRIERWFPPLGGRLSTAISFLSDRQDKARGDSEQMRQQVVSEAARLSEQLDFNATLDSRGPRQAALVAAGIFLMVGGLAGLNSGAADLAIFRLAMPWRNQPWPRRNELSVVDPPHRVLAGSDVEIAVVDRRGTIPQRVQLLVLHDAQGGWRPETKEMRREDSRMVYRLTNVTKRFAFRARGGDDNSMPWTEVDVIEPPKIVDLEFVVQPPAYTGRSSQANKGRIVEALVGSELRLRGRLDKPISSIRLRRATPDSTLPAIELGGDGKSFVAGSAKAPWILERSGDFWFEMTDRQGQVVRGQPRLELRAKSDLPPTIAWFAPADGSSFTAKAVVAVKGTVKDDIEVRSIQLHHGRSRGPDVDRAIQLFIATGQTSTKKVEPDQNLELREETESRSFEFELDLAAIEGLVPGEEVTLQITAEDSKGQVTTTEIRRLKIIGEEQIAASIAAQQSQIESQLSEALAISRTTREQTSAVQNRLRTSGNVGVGDVSQLQAAEYGQWQVQQVMGSSTDGVETRLLALLGQLQANRSSGGALGRRLEELLNEVKELNRTRLPSLEQAIVGALKGMESANRSTEPSPRGQPVASEVVNWLQTAGTEEDALIQSLESMVRKVTEWNDLSRLSSEAEAVRADQEQLASRAGELRSKALLSRDASSSGQIPAREAAENQLELARRFDKLQSRMENMIGALQTSDPQSSHSLAESLAVARRSAIGGKMREAAQQFADRQFGHAEATARAVQQALAELQRALTNSTKSQESSDDANRHQQPASGQDQDQNNQQLRLIIKRQQDVNGGTLELQTQRETNGLLPEEQRRAAAELAISQGNLADIVLRLATDGEVQPQRPPEEANGRDLKKLSPSKSQAKLSLDQQLLEGLEAPPRLKPEDVPAESDANAGLNKSSRSESPLPQIARQMRAVQSRLAQHDTSAATQGAQEQILQALMALLDKTRRPSGPAGSQQATEKRANQTGGSGDPTSRDGRSTAQRTEASGPVPADLKEVMRRVWGDLPDKLRDQMQASLSEQFLPSYQRLIEDYYRSLAKDQRAPP
jgi:hypothetical protein